MVLPYKDIETVDYYYTDPTDTVLHPGGAPTYWYMWGGTVRVFPTPDLAYTVTLRYMKRPSEMSANTDVPSVPQEFKEYLVLAAAGRAQEDNDNYDQAVYLLRRADNLAAKLIGRYAKKSTSPTVMKINRISHNATGK